MTTMQTVLRTAALASVAIAVSGGFTNQAVAKPTVGDITSGWECTATQDNIPSPTGSPINGLSTISGCVVTATYSITDIAGITNTSKPQSCGTFYHVSGTGKNQVVNPQFSQAQCSAMLDGSLTAPCNTVNGCNSSTAPAVFQPVGIARVPVK